MNETETRYAELRADGGNLRGTVLAYGDTAVIGGQPERFLPGAFDPIGDVILNFQHQRARPLARTGGDLELTDDAEALRMAAKMPDTADGRDALTLVRQGVLRGLSVEFRAITERLEGGVRIVEKAILTGLGLVDRAAYGQSVVEARELEIIEDRQRGRRLRGSIPYGALRTINDRQRVRKETYLPGVWRASLELEQEILLQMGNIDRVIASRKAGSLRISDSDKQLSFLADIPNDVSYIDDLVEHIRTNQVIYVLRPYQRIPPVEVVPSPYRDVEEIPGSGIFIRQYKDMILNSIDIVPRGGVGNVSLRSQPWL